MLTCFPLIFFYNQFTGRLISPDTKEGVAEKPPMQPGGGTEPEEAAWKSGFGVRGRIPLLILNYYTHSNPISYSVANQKHIVYTEYTLNSF